jgi:hypothetical protein
MFSLAIHPIILKACDPAHSGIKGKVTPMAVLDDMYFVGDARDLLLVLNYMQRELHSQLNLHINIAKSQFIYLHTNDHPLPDDISAAIAAAQLTLYADGAKVLGGAIGRTAADIELLVREQLRGDNDLLFERIESESFPVQHAMLTLRHCAMPRMHFATRITPPDACTDIAAEFDERMLLCALRKLHLTSESSEYIRDRLQQRVTAGGFGLLSSEKRHTISYIASLSIAMHHDTDNHFHHA